MTNSPVSFDSWIRPGLLVDSIRAAVFIVSPNLLCKHKMSCFVTKSKSTVTSGDLQLETGTFTAQNAGSDLARMNSDSQIQIRRVGTKLCFQISCDNFHRIENVGGETHHDRRVIGTWVRETGGCCIHLFVRVVTEKATPIRTNPKLAYLQHNNLQRSLL